MPKTRENFIHQYWDKALLLLLAAVGIYVFLGRVLSSPIKTSGDGPALGPQQLVSKLVQETSALESQLGQPKVRAYPAPEYLQQIEERFRKSPTGGRNAWVAHLPAKATTRLGLVQIPTPKVLKPLSVRAQSGIGLVSTSSPGSRRGTTQAASSESGPAMYWVTVAAEFPFRNQYRAFAGVEPLVDRDRRSTEKGQDLLFARLDVERQELLANGSWSPAESINPYELYSQEFEATVKHLAELYALSSDEEQLDNVNALRSWLGRKGFQEFIVRPEFFTLEGFEQWYWPEPPANLTDNRGDLETIAGPLPTRDESPRYREEDRRGSQDTTRGRTVRVPSQRVPARGLPAPMLGGPAGVLVPPGFAMSGTFGQPGMAPSVGRRPGSAATGRGRAEKRIEIPRGSRLEDAPESIGMWAHDISAKPGCTYRYRMRVVMFNPLCGDERAENKKTRRQAWLTGDWSDWSGPVETLERRQFFLTSVSPGTDSKPPRARVMVYAWERGWWYNSLFSCTDAGQKIGAPRDVPDFVLASDPVRARLAKDTLRSGSRGSDLGPGGDRRSPPPRGPGPRPKITVDFTTDWVIVDITAEVQLDEPVDNTSATVRSATTSELVVMEKTSGKLAKRYSVMDRDDPQKQELEELIGRQDKAFKAMERRPERRSRTTIGPRRRPGSSKGGAAGMPVFP